MLPAMGLWMVCGLDMSSTLQTSLRDASHPQGVWSVLDITRLEASAASPQFVIDQGF